MVHREDEDVTDAIGSLFEDEGIDVVLNARVKAISGRSGKAVRIVIEASLPSMSTQGRSCFRSRLR
jgi:phytoene dehydrogenase-like protein